MDEDRPRDCTVAVGRTGSSVGAVGGGIPPIQSVLAKKRCLYFSANSSALLPQNHPAPSLLLALTLLHSRRSDSPRGRNFSSFSNFPLQRRSPLRSRGEYSARRGARYELVSKQKILSLSSTRTFENGFSLDCSLDIREARSTSPGSYRMIRLQS